MTTPRVTWTQALADAAQELGATAYDGGATIPERAREMRYMRAGQVLTAMQLDCVAMLRSRMHEGRPAEEAFNAAWRAAWEAREGDGGDHALQPQVGELYRASQAVS